MCSKCSVASKQYDDAKAPLWKQYEDAKATLWKQYDDAKAPLWKQYEDVTIKNHPRAR